MELVNKHFVGDFLGFTYNGIHSSTLGLVRVSAGNRYQKNLFPAFTNKTVQPEGKDGFYYFGAYYTNNQMQIDTSFDNLSEEQFQKLSTAFSCKKFKELWFDETPYKAFWAKIAESPQIKYLCFTGDDGKRVYKGELILKFEMLESWAHNRVVTWGDGVQIIRQTGNNPDYSIFTLNNLDDQEDKDEDLRYLEFVFQGTKLGANGIITRKTLITYYVSEKRLKDFFTIMQDNNINIQKAKGIKYKISDQEDLVLDIYVDNLISGNHSYYQCNFENLIYEDNTWKYKNSSTDFNIIYKNKQWLDNQNANCRPKFGNYLNYQLSDLNTNSPGVIFESFNFKDWIDSIPSNITNNNYGVKEGDFLIKYKISKNGTNDMLYKFKILYDNKTKEFIIKIKNKLFGNNTTLNLYIDSKKRIVYTIDTNGKKNILNIERRNGNIFTLPLGEYTIEVKKKIITELNKDDDTGWEDGSVLVYSNNLTGDYVIKPYYYFY